MSFSEMPYQVVCNLCNDVMFTAVKLNCGNHHHLDEECAIKFFNGRYIKECPDCHKPISSYVRDYEFRNIVSIIVTPKESSWSDPSNQKEIVSLIGFDTDEARFLVNKFKYKDFYKSETFTPFSAKYDVISSLISNVLLTHYLARSYYSSRK